MSEEDRIVDLEIKFAFQERLLADLDGVVQALRAQVDTLREEVAQLHAALRPDAQATVDEKPPHW
jgi:uncharacterized coiled-coil protein SlyX